MCVMVQVDVLLPIKTPAPWLGATLESLKAQTFTDWQLVASIHGEDPLARETVLAHVPDAKIVTAPGDGNLASTLNVGLRATESPYVARIDQDDIALPQRFQVQIDYMELNPEVVVVGSGATLIGVEGEILGYREQLEEHRMILKTLRWKSPLIHPSVMFHRQAVLDLGGYSESATNVEDYDLWLRLGCIGRLAGINQPLIQYRIHPDQITSFRSIPKSASKRVKSSRLCLAESESRSCNAASARHKCWAAVQFVRRFKRKRRT